MNATNTNSGSIFFLRSAPVYALCATLALPALGQDSGNPGKPDDTKDVKVSDYGTVDISVQDTDLATVLQMLSIESKKNIITSKGVSATVSANLYDVTFQEALKAILDVNGYTFYEEGNFIYVITKEEAAAMEKARRKTESRIFELNYLSATDANEFIQPLLSDDGKASARGAAQPGMKPDVGNNGADEYAFTPRLVINDFPERLEAMATLLSSLDTPPQQVLVEATILQTSLDETNAFGVDFTVLGSLNFTDLTSPLAAVNNLLGGANATNGFQPEDNRAQAVSSTVGNTEGPGGLKVGIMSDDISVFLRVLDEVIDTTVLARPKVMALNRQRAEVLVGARIGYLSTTSTETTTTQNVQFLDTGIQLIFRPFISTDGMIRMELKPSVSEFKLRDVTDATGAIVTIPDELTNQVTTNVRIKDGQTLVLGGLFKDTTKVTRRQVPLLGDIPIVGAAFRGQDDKVERSEVIFLITPSIVHDSNLWAAGQEHMDAVDSLHVGARAELLPFSREKVTTNYNQKAQEAYNSGDTEKALYYINNSLGMNPDQPEMIRLREKITGERAKDHERSLMERTFRKHIGPIAEPQAMNQPQDDSTMASASAESTTSDVSADASTVSETSTTEQIASESTSDSSTQTVEVASEQTEPSTSTDVTTDVEPSVEEPSTEQLVEVSPEVAPEMPVEQPEVESSPEEATTLAPTNIAPPAFDVPATPESSSTSSAKEMTPEQWMFYQQFLFNFFVALDMPELASTFECEQDMQYASEFPFTTFEDMNAIVGVSKSQDPQE